MTGFIRGARIAARYALEEPLGEGGLAEAWRARDLLWDEPVTLKLLVRSDAARREALRAEFVRLGGLEHPRLVRVRDFGVSAGPGGAPLAFYAADYLPGATLDRWMEGRGWDARRAALVDALHALAFLHGLGIRHGDFKPANILVGDDGRGTLIDLSAAAALRTSGAEAIAGTRGYVAPELLAGARADARADLYAVGRTLAELAADELAAEVPASVSSLAMRLLSEAPNGRPASVAEVLEALGADAELAPPGGAAPRLLGRDAELAALRGWVDALHASAAAPRAVAVVGPDGVGRTRLLQEIKAYAQLAGSRVESSGFESSGFESSVIEGSAAAPSPVASMLGLALAQPPPRGLGAALEARDRIAGGSQPTLLILDDAHRLPEPDRALLEALARCASPTDRLLLVVAGRDAPPGAHALALAPLPPEAVTAWAAGQLSSTAARHLHRVTGGLPADIRGVLARIRAGDLTEGDLQSAASRPARARLDRELAGVDAAGREALAWLATAGPRPGPVPEGLPWLALQRTGWVIRARDGWRLAVPARAEALAAALPREARAAREGHARSALEQAREARDPDEAAARWAAAAEHLARAQRDGDAAALWLEQPDAIARAPRAWMAAAEALLPRIEALPRPVALALARALEAAGAPARALSLLARLRRDATPSEVPAIRAQAASASLNAGRLAAAVRHARRAVEAPVEPPLGAEHLGRAWTARAHGLIQLGRHAEAIAATEAGLAAPLADPARASLLEARALASVYLGDLDGARAALVEARAASDGGPRAAVRLASYEAMAAYAAGDLEAAEAGYAEALRVASARGLDDQRASALVNLGTVQQRRGDWGRAEASYTQGLRLSRALGKASTQVALEINLANLFAQIGLPARARVMLERARDGARGGQRCALALIEGELALAAGELVAARASATRARELAEAAGAARERIEACVLQAEVEVSAGALDAADAALAQARAPFAEDASDLAIRAALAGGALALARGDGAEAVSILEQAVERATQAGEGDLEAVALARLAEGCRRAGSPELAREAAARARRRWERTVLTLRPEAREAFWQHPTRRGVAAPAVERGDADLRLRRVMEINRRLGASRSSQEVLATALDAAIELTGAERGFVLLPADPEADAAPNDAGPGFEVAAARNVDRAQLTGDHLEFSRRITDEVIARGEPILTHDAALDDRFRGNASVHAMRLKSVLAAPIRAGDRAVGALYLDNRLAAGRFTAADAELLLGLSDQVAVALEGARLVEELRQKTALLEAQAVALEARRAEVEALARRQSDAIGELEAEVRRQRGALGGPAAFGEVLGRSAAMRALFALLERVARSPLDVLIRGESGTGKELVARAIHREGPRRDGPFVAINCAAIPSALLESELFGHARGAFTGADRDREGLFVSASGGTLLLDEVGEMPLEMQAKLLRALQEREVLPLGARRAVGFDVRVLAATHRDLAGEIAAGRFREDLYYRLAVVEVEVPPLRERPDDVAPLAEAILARVAAQHDASPPRLTIAALEALEAHPWPGNVRQLTNALARAWLMSDGRRIRREDVTLPDAPGRARGPRVPERERIRRALSDTDWNVSEVSRILGIPRNTLYRRMKRYGLARPPG